MAEFRKESDLIGELNVPVDALYGVQSLRGFNNFKISGVPMNAYPNFIKGFAITTTILSIALLTSFFVLQWTDDIFLQYVNYLLITPSLVNTITAIIIIVVPLLVLMMLAESIRMLILLKRKA